MSHVTGQVTGENGDDVATLQPHSAHSPEPEDNSDVWVETSHHRRARSSECGKPRKEHRRSVKLAVMVYPEDMTDLEELGRAWHVPTSTLCWAVVHEWLARSKGVTADLRDVRGPLRMTIEVALADRELGPWLRREIARMTDAGTKDGHPVQPV